MIKMTPTAKKIAIAAAFGSAHRGEQNITTRIESLFPRKIDSKELTINIDGVAHVTEFHDQCGHNYNIRLIISVESNIFPVNFQKNVGDVELLDEEETGNFCYSLIKDGKAVSDYDVIMDQITRAAVEVQKIVESERDLSKDEIVNEYQPNGRRYTLRAYKSGLKEVETFARYEEDAGYKIRLTDEEWERLIADPANPELLYSLIINPIGHFVYISSRIGE